MYISIVGRISQSALPSFLMLSEFKRRLREQLSEKEYGGGICGLVITVDSLDADSGLTAVTRKARKQRNTKVRNEQGMLVALKNLYEAGVVVDALDLSKCKNEREVLRLIIDSIEDQSTIAFGGLKGFSIDVFLQDLKRVAGI